MSGDKKRTAVKARKQQMQSAKGARRRQRRTEIPRRSDSRTVTRTNQQGLSITVQLPLRRTKQPYAAIPLWRRLFRQPLVYMPLGLILLVAAAVIMQAGGHGPADKPVVTAERTAPDFKPLEPSAEKASEPRYDPKRNMVSYTTNFSGSRITVSQQRLPAHFAKDSKALIRAADSINAKQKLDTAKGPLYIASNEKGNDQMALIALADVLLFIHADRQLDESSWKAFVELLKIKS